MLRLRRRCAQTARISLHYIKFSKSYLQTKNVRSANSLAYPFAPCLQIFRTFTSCYRRFRPSPSRFRFGEAVFTETARKLQEQKTRSSQKFCRNRKTTQNLVVDARKPTNDAAPWQFSCACSISSLPQAVTRRRIPPLGTSRNANRPKERPR